MILLRKSTLFILFILLPIPGLSDERFALSTSGFLELRYINDDGVEVVTCDGPKAGFGNSYVSIGVEKFTVNRNDPLLKRIFNSDRRAFAAASLSAKYQNQEMSVVRVGKPVLLKGSESNVDMGVQWNVIERVPWLLRDANLKLRLGYTAESSLDSMIEALEGVTASIPNYTISSSLATGTAITGAVDNLLFGSGRAFDLLNANRDLPLFAGQLCEGYYAVFSAENNSTYEKYYSSKLTWSGSDLTLNGEPIKDSSYVVVRVDVSDSYYDNPGISINDLSRSWASKYQEVQSSLFDLIWISNNSQLDDVVRRIRSNLLEARTLLSADINLIQDEKNSIHQHAVDDFKSRLELAAVRIDAEGNVTKESTANALLMGLNSKDAPFQTVPADQALRLLKNPEVNLQDIDSGFSAEFRSAIGNTRSVLSVQ